MDHFAVGHRFEDERKSNHVAWCFFGETGRTAVREEPTELSVDALYDIGLSVSSCQDVIAAKGK